MGFYNSPGRRWSPSHWWIVAGADEPEEDQSKWSCTLLEPICVDGDGGGDAEKVVRFRHVQLVHYARLWRASPPYSSSLFAGSAEHGQDQCDVPIIDWESLLILPKLVAFKGDNGKYLSAPRTIEGYPYLQFASDSDETTTSNNNSSDTLFWPIKVDDNAKQLSEKWFDYGSQRINQLCKKISTGSGALRRETVGNRLEPKSRVVLETLLNICVTEEEIVDVIGDEEGDVEAGEAEKLGELKHGVYMALCPVGEDADMWGKCFYYYWIIHQWFIFLNTITAAL